MLNIMHYLDPSFILFLDHPTRDEALQSLVDALYAAKKLKDPHSFLHAILEREKIVTTGIGMGVAIPHAKLADYNDFFIAVAVVKEGISWDSIDHAPVRLIFLIGGPDDKQTEYLQILSCLTLAIKDEERRKKLLNAKNPEVIINLFEGF